MKSKFYRVTCKCGHVGRDHYVRIDFPVNADSAKEAAAIARGIGRVKHHHKDAILACREIDFEEYEILQKMNARDPYLRCKNVQEQRDIASLSLRLEKENNEAVQEECSRKEYVLYLLKKEKEKFESSRIYEREAETME